MRLRITPRCKDCEKPFWALDKFEMCSLDELRILSTESKSGDITCDVLKYPNSQIKYTEVKLSKPSANEETQCPNGIFGISCTECERIFGANKTNCDKSIICKLNPEGNSICRCSYGSYGSTCEQQCSGNHYGRNCENTCGFCVYQPCDPVTGYCAANSCINNFTDRWCKTAPLPILLNPPTIVEVKPTSVVVQVLNFTYEGLGSPDYYQIQYKEYSQKEWNKLSSHHMMVTYPIIIEDLNILTKYQLRAVLLTQNGEAYERDYVPKIDVNTTCSFIKENDITKSVYNTSAIFVFKENPDSCRLEDYNLKIDKTGSLYRKGTTSEMMYLQPFTDYNVTITNTKANETLFVVFKTLEGVPSKVLNLKVTKNEIRKVVVSWNPPSISHGNIRHYKVQYEHVNYKGCTKQKIKDENSKQYFQEKNTAITLTELLPFSEYQITVSAVTIEDGPPVIITATTLQTDSPDEEELPRINKIEAESKRATVFFNFPNCTLIKGSLQYHVTWHCSNKWCQNSPLNKTFFDDTDVNPPIIEELLPYSSYTLAVKIGRINGNVLNGDGITETFTTKASEPNPVRDLTVYSRNENSISLRFLPPYPPNGELVKCTSKYCFTIPATWRSKSETKCDESPLLFKRCKIWEDKQCAVIQNLDSEKDYEIYVFAKNRGTSWGNYAKIVGKTRQDAPGVPENPTASWDDYYNLTLSWNHPSITNGQLTKFNVKIYCDKGYDFESSYSVKEESFVYNYVVPFNGTCYSAKLDVYLSAFNIKESNSVNCITYSPPKTPSFSVAPFVDDVTNTTVTINLPSIKDLDSASHMYIIISAIESDLKMNTNNEIEQKIWKKAGIPSLHSWTVAEYNLTLSESPQKSFKIGSASNSNSSRLNKTLFNDPLLVRTNYTVTVLLINEYKGNERYSVYKLAIGTYGIKPEEFQTSNKALFALLLLLIIPLALLWYVFRRTKISKVNIAWNDMLGMTRNSSHDNNSNPDVIPLTTKAERKPNIPRKPPSQVRLKHKPPNNPLEEPSTSKTNDMFSKPVKITEFEKYVKESIANGELEKQHQLFPRGRTKPWDYGSLPQNKSKNRYNNLIAYDHTRVKLERINNDTFSDYINANYIQGHNTKNAYIATQGPKAATVNDFWRMIWQENVNYIVMLANVIEGGKKNTEQYWPSVNEYLEFGKIKIEYFSSQVFADFEYRTFMVSCENVERKVEQLHFTSWPDHGIPLYSQSLVPFLHKLLTIPQGTSPIVVHCSAGVGRTGTIILCDLCLRMAAREGIVDVLKHQHNLRQQRANLVDNIEQYKLAHLVLLECMIAPQTTITCDEEMESAVLLLLESGKLKDQMKYLNSTAWQDQAMRPAIEVTANPEWASKNRFQDITPSGYGRVYLTRYPVSDEHSDYINAVEVDGFRAPQRFIVTQQPLPNTVSDFWRMIDEKEVTTVVSLNKINKDDQTSCVFWPTSKVPEIKPVPYIILHLHEKSVSEHYDIINVHLHNSKNQSKRTVHLIILKGWLPNKLLPETETSLLKLWEEADRMSRGDKPVVVTCYNGSTGCGIFLALSFIVEKMKLEQQCDVCLAVRNIRHNREQFVAEEEQFAFLYRVALNYLTSFDLYSNFTPAVRK